MNEPRADSEPAPVVTRLPIVGVMGASNAEHEPKAGELGRALARLDVHLLTGGGSGTMLACSRGFCSVEPRRGLSIGVLPRLSQQRLAYPNPFVELPIMTHLPFSGERGTDPLSRNHINVLSARVVIALPGGPGTLSEVVLATTYAKPVMAYIASESELAGLPGGVPRSNDLDEVLDFVRGAITRA